MKTMTVRDIRQRWPEAEKALALEGEIIVTRDSKPVARILPFTEATDPKAINRFDFDEHMRWLKRISKGEKPMPSSDEMLRRDRED